MSWDTNCKAADLLKAAASAGWRAVQKRGPALLVHIRIRETSFSLSKALCVFASTSIAHIRTGLSIV